jgi:transcriptional regulator with XRE-family HTH domain
LGGQAGGGGRFGDLLRAHRLAAGLTQEELAGQCGLSPRAVADMERGRTARPYRRSVTLLAEALGLTGEEGALFARAARAAWRW